MNELPTEINDSFSNENEYIFKKYKTLKKIGQGAFGNIYSVKRLNDNEIFAMKTEKKKSENKTLESEAYYLYTLQGFGIPKLITYGFTKNYNILIETLLGKSIYYIFLQNNSKCNLIDVCLIGLQILERLEWIHSKDIIYRDVKPENFLIGIKDPNVIYIVDFGLCKKYRSSKTGKHLLPKLTGRFNGTLKYASPNVIKGKESSRRDDLISLGYMLIFLLKRDLPWEDTFKNLDKLKYFELVHLKDTNANGKLFSNLPQEFAEYIKYSRNLKFEQDPDYSYLSFLLKKILIKSHLDCRKLTFSWVNKKSKKFIGMPKSTSKRKISPQCRLLKSLREERIKRLKREAISEINLVDLNFSIPKIINIDSPTIEEVTTKNALSEKIQLDENSTKINSIKNSENEEKNNIDTKKNLNNLNVIYIKKKPNLSIYNSRKCFTNRNIFKANKKIQNKIMNSAINKTKSRIINNSDIKELPLALLKKDKNKSNKNFHLRINSDINKNNNSITLKFYTKNMNCFYNNNISSHENEKEKKNQINLSNNIKYKSPLMLKKIRKVNLKMNYKNFKTINNEINTPKKLLLHYKVPKPIEISKTMIKNNNKKNKNNNNKNLNIILFNNKTKNQLKKEKCNSPFFISKTNTNFKRYYINKSYNNNNNDYSSSENNMK